MNSLGDQVDVSGSTVPNYDVYLSFSGSDTRKGFIDHLYHALKQAAISTFRYVDVLHGGEPIGQQMEKAIKQSSISIIVFSENYASSRWCLNELEMILEQKKLRRNHTVLPIFYQVDPSDVRHQKGSYEIFYQVDPSDVRHQKGSYEKAFNRHIEKGRVSKEKIKAWKAALTEAANLAGLHFNGSRLDQMEFISDILREVKMIIANRKALYVPQHLLGMNYRAYGIETWFEDRSKGNNVLVIGGIGGMGKTTIAKHFYSEYHRDFDGSCFLARITEMWDQIGVCALQTQLLSNIVDKREEIRIYNYYEGTKKIERALDRKKVLVVLDDVSETEQLNALLGRPRRFFPGSKVLVTTRDVSLVKDFIVDTKVHKIGGLNDEESLELFSRHAFRQHYPPKKYMGLSEEICLHCEGLPLALEVLGSSLRKKLDTFFWEKQLQKWDEAVNPDIQKVLQISYDSLEDDTDKNLFLDIACFFVGEEEDYVVKILDDCGVHVGIQNLIDRCLIARHDKKLVMHQVIQDMGREIVRQESNEPGNRSRLWYEDAFTILKHDKGSEAVQGLILDGQRINKMGSDGSRGHLIMKIHGYVKKRKELIEFDEFTKMVNLKLLKLNHIHLTGSCYKFPKKLRWISWHGCPLLYVPMELPLDNLVSLDLQHSRLRQVWKEYKEVKSLKFLNLSYSQELYRTPDFSGLLQLERLILRGCSDLVEVCETIGILKGLVLLDLRDCTSIMNLPALPESIVTLDLSGCSVLRVSPSIKFGWIRTLKLGSPIIIPIPKDKERDAKKVDLMNNKLFLLPAQSSGQFCHPVLVKLFLQNTDLMEIPLSFFESMPMLQVLDLSNTSLKCLPSTIGRLVALQKFFLRDCQLLMELPPEIGELTNLKVLDVEGTKLICLHLQIRQLLNLECLKVSFYGYYADRYRERNGIESIIPPKMLSELTQLKELSIKVDPEGKWWAKEVEAIMNDMGNIKCLESLKLYMPSAAILQQFLKLTRAWDGSLVHSSLSNFELSIGHHEEYIPRVPHGLQEQFKRLPKYLGFTNGKGITYEIGKILTHVEALFLHRHWTAVKLSEFTINALDRLKFCLVAVCNAMETIIDGVDYYKHSRDTQPVLQYLEYLCVYHMKNLEAIWKGPIVPGCLSHLKILALHVCPNLTTVLTRELLANLSNLTVIIIESCPEITSLVTIDQSLNLEPDHLLLRLKKITLLDLPKLISIYGGICIAPNLERMVIYGCPMLESRSISEVSCNEIKGESEWWEALNSPESDMNSDSDHLNCVFIPFGDDDDDLVDEFEEAADSLQQFKQVEDTEFWPKYQDDEKTGRHEVMKIDADASMSLKPLPSSSLVSVGVAKVVFKLDNYNNKMKNEAMKSLSNLSGIHSIDFSMEDEEMTVTGKIDPLLLQTELRKLFETELSSVGPQKEEASTSSDVVLR